MLPRPFGKDQVTIHGTLVRLGNEGILLRGDAGVGKSTAALELIADGGQLVADDVVVIRRLGNMLFGAAPHILKGILAIPEVGIFDVREVIGRDRYAASSVITRCVELGSLAEAADGGGDAEFHGIGLPRTYQKVEQFHESTVFPHGIALLSVKESETRFFQRHRRAVTTSSAH